MFLKNLIILIISYLLGSINTSIIISKIMLHDDIRNHGSKNAGATNALRIMGKKGAILVVIGDILKAVLSIIIAKLILPSEDNAIYIAGIGVILGHNFPLYFGFKGGKGIIVSTVSMLFADPMIGVFVVAVSILIMAISRYVSLGSILGAALFVVLSLIFKNQNPDFIVFSLIISILAIYMHKTNIKRLLSGTENKLF